LFRSRYGKEKVKRRCPINTNIKILSVNAFIVIFYLLLLGYTDIVSIFTTNTDIIGFMLIIFMILAHIAVLSMMMPYYSVRDNRIAHKACIFSVIMVIAISITFFVTYESLSQKKGYFSFETFRMENRSYK